MNEVRAFVGHSFTPYRRAAELGETLAMSNLGYKLMQVGFFLRQALSFNERLILGISIKMLAWVSPRSRKPPRTRIRSNRKHWKTFSRRLHFTA